MTTNTIVSTLALDIVDSDVLEITPRSAVEAKVLSKEQAKLNIYFFFFFDIYF